MCIFCAAIPATLAVGARLNAKQNNSQKISESQGQPARRKKLPVSPFLVQRWVFFRLIPLFY